MFSIKNLALALGSVMALSGAVMPASAVAGAHHYEEH